MRASTIERHRPGPPRWRRVLFRLLSVGLALASVLALAELALWAIVPGSTASLFIYQPGTLRHKVMRPNVRAKVYGVPIETNGSGFRSKREFSRAKPRGGVRLVALGDSFLVSAGVRFADILTARLERLLDDALPDAGVEVYNLAVAGHEILHHAATLKEVALGYHPDVVLVFLYPINDIEVRGYDAEERYIRAHARGEAPLALAPKRPGLRRLQTYRLLLPRVIAAVHGIGPLRPLLPPLTFERTLEAYRQRASAWRRSFAALQEMARLASSSGIPMQVFLLPSIVRPFEEQRAMYALASEMVEEAGLPVVSLIDAFVADGRPARGYAVSLVDAHPDADYNARAAASVARHLIDAGIVQSRLPRPRDPRTARSRPRDTPPDLP